jgi:lysozyme family protein
MSFDQAVTFVLEREGGLSDDPTDPGGLTNFGISQRAYPDLDIRHLTVEGATAIYKRDYWDAAGCDALTPAVALAVFDSAVNCGVQRAKEWLAHYPDPQDYLWRRVAYYRSLVQNKPALLTFLVGWVRRLELLRDAMGGMT